MTAPGWSGAACTGCLVPGSGQLQGAIDGGLGDIGQADIIVTGRTSVTGFSLVQMPGRMQREANWSRPPGQLRPSTGLDVDGWSRFHHVSARSNHSVRLAWIRWQVVASRDGR